MQRNRFPNKDGPYVNVTKAVDDMGNYFYDEIFNPQERFDFDNDYDAIVLMSS